MILAQHHYLLFTSSTLYHNEAVDEETQVLRSGKWSFVLESLATDERLEAADTETGIHPDRLDLLALVRGLEALDQPSQVRLVTTSRYVSRGLKYGLSTWRDQNYEWERFGERLPVRNADLWRRISTALEFHTVTSRLLSGLESTQMGAAQQTPSAAMNQTLKEVALVRPRQAVPASSQRVRKPGALLEVANTMMSWWKERAAPVVSGV